MSISRTLSSYIDRFFSRSIHLFNRARYTMISYLFRSCRCGRFSSELVPAFIFQQGKLVPVRVDIRRFR